MSKITSVDLWVKASLNLVSAFKNNAILRGKNIRLHYFLSHLCHAIQSHIAKRQTCHVSVTFAAIFRWELLSINRPTLHLRLVFSESDKSRHINYDPRVSLADGTAIFRCPNILQPCCYWGNINHIPRGKNKMNIYSSFSKMQTLSCFWCDF